MDAVASMCQHYVCIRECATKCVIVKVPKWKIADMKEHMYALLQFCATRGVIVTIEEKEKSIEMQLDSVIYLEGLNKRVFEQVLRFCKSASRRRSN